MRFTHVMEPLVSKWKYIYAEVKTKTGKKVDVDIGLSTAVA